MCEANVYLREGDGALNLFFERVDRLMPDGGGQWVLQDIFGSRKIIKGDVEECQLADHRIIMRKAAL